MSSQIAVMAFGIVMSVIAMINSLCNFIAAAICIETLLLSTVPQEL